MPKPAASGPEALLDVWATAQRAEGASDKTVRLGATAVTLAARHAGCSAASLRTDQVRAFLAGYASAWTRATFHSRLCSWSKFLVAEGVRSDDPMAAVRRTRPPRAHPRPCSADALAALLAVDDRRRAMAVLGAFAGLRASEIARVHGDDVDLAAGTIRVIGKGGVEALLPLHPLLAEVAAGMPDRDWWFPSRTRPGLPVVGNTVTRLLDGAHRLRHSFGTNLARGGADTFTVQSLMRHASPVSSAGYVEIGSEDRRAAMLRLPKLMPTGGVQGKAAASADRLPVAKDALAETEAGLAGAGGAAAGPGAAGGNFPAPRGSTIPDPVPESGDEISSPMWPGEHAVGRVEGHLYCSECGPLAADDVLWSPYGRVPWCPRRTMPPEPTAMELIVLGCPPWCDGSDHYFDRATGALAGDLHSMKLSAHLFMSRTDTYDGPGPVVLEFAAEDIEEMTPAQARMLAAELLDAADAAEVATA